MSRDPALNTITVEASDAAVAVQVAAPLDALSRPSTDDLLLAALTLWPVGAAWGSPDGAAIALSSRIAGLTRVMVEPFAQLYARAWKITRESSVSGADELIDEWEADYGLPDSCGGSAGVGERLRMLEAKVAALAIITPGDFIRIARDYGYSITIEEPAMFECGFSECGGQHTVGDVRQEAYWIAHVADLAVDYFRVGHSVVGRDPLFSLGESERLLCMLRRLAPAWTTPVIYTN